jgi:hypothetical protein
MSLNASLLIAPLIDLIAGGIIQSGTGGDGPKIIARATELIAINTALQQVNAGNVAGLPALQQALQTTALSPAETLALQSVLAALANQVALLTSIAGSTLLGQAATTVFDSILTTATTAAQAYITKYTPASAAT